MPHDSTAATRGLLTLCVLAALALLLFLHPYDGVVHDARLYTIQALSHLQPELYRNDIFVRFGSQDDFTLFSPLYSATISGLGMERAAATLTFLAICVFLAAAWLLARTLLPVRQAAMAMLLLLVVPAYYGPGRIFYFLEEFITPRQLAEALTLFFLTAWFRHRRLLALALAAGAMLMHPLIGVAGVALVVMLEWVVPHWRRLWPLAAMAGVVFALAAAGWLPVSRWQFDAEWHQIVMRRSYLGLRSWDLDDWGRVAAVLATLGVAGWLLQDLLRRVAAAAFFTTVGMLLLTLLGGDLLRLVIVVQAQPWRALWLATVLAILLLPPLYVRAWGSGAMARCALLLLAAAWSAHYGTPALVAAPLALLAAALAALPVAPASGRLLLSGAWATLGVVVICNLATGWLGWNDGLTMVESLPPLLDELLTVSQNGLLPALLLLAGGGLLMRYPSRLVMTALALPVLVLIAMFARPAARSWTYVRYNDAVREAYAPWRAVIPPGSDVMWVSQESWWGDGASNSWLLLQRPSFLSSTQAPNALFSRPAAIEMRDRARSLWGLLPFADPFRPKASRNSIPSQPMRLAPICQAAAVRYVVTSANLIDATPLPAPASAPLLLRDHKLYTCT